MKWNPFSPAGKGKAQSISSPGASRHCHAIILLKYLGAVKWLSSHFLTSLSLALGIGIKMRWRQDDVLTMAAPWMHSASNYDPHLARGILKLPFRNTPSPHPNHNPRQTTGSPTAPKYVRLHPQFSILPIYQEPAMPLITLYSANIKTLTPSGVKI